MNSFLTSIACIVFSYFTVLSAFQDVSHIPLEKISSKKSLYRRASLRHTEGSGRGYKGGYTTLEGFLSPDPDTLPLNIMPFVDVRGHFFNKGKCAANVGIGIRKINESKIHGLNFFYDHRKTDEIKYNQVGFGFEALGKSWDLRINSYFPVGALITDPYEVEFAAFTGHHMLVSQKTHCALRGGNAELGFNVLKKRSLNFYTAVGSYFYKGKIGSAIGGVKSRLKAQYKDYATLELSHSYDKSFHNKFQCELTFSVPFGSGAKEWIDDALFDESKFLYSKMVQPVKREEIIPVKRQTERVTAVDPVTGKPYYFVFVDNTSNSLGTYESPYPTLALAQAYSKQGDIVYVFPGDGTTRGMDAGIRLKENQKFWGSGTIHTLETVQGAISIPAHSATAPKITNPDGDAITLASTNQVSGFTITDALRKSITGTALKNIELSDCTIKDNGEEDHIHLEYSGDSAVAVLRNLTIQNSVIDAVYINSTADLTTCTMTNCKIEGSQRYVIKGEFADKVTFNLLNNTIDDNTNGSNFTFEGPSSLVVTGNTFKDTTSVSDIPLYVSAQTDPLVATISNNIFNENTCGSIKFNLINTDTAQLLIDGNNIINNGSGDIAALGSAIVIDPDGTDGNCRLTLTNNNISGSQSRALNCTDGAFNDFQVVVAGNTLTGNGGGLVFNNPCENFNLTVANNTILDSQDHAITTPANTIATATMIISDNQITGNVNGASGIALAHSGTTLNLTVTGNILSQNSTSGIIMYPADQIEDVVVKIENNNIENNQNLGANAAGGIDLEQYINLSGTVTHNTFSNNTDGDFYIGSTKGNTTVGLEMSGNTSTNGYRFENNDGGGGVFNLAPCNFDDVNTGAITTTGTITYVHSNEDPTPCAD